MGVTATKNSRIGNSFVFVIGGLGLGQQDRGRQSGVAEAVSQQLKCEKCGNVMVIKGIKIDRWSDSGPGTG